MLEPKILKGKLIGEFGSLNVESQVKHEELGNRWFELQCVKLKRERSSSTGVGIMQDQFPKQPDGPLFAPYLTMPLSGFQSEIPLTKNKISLPLTI